MSELSQQQCEACSWDAPHVSEAEIDEYRQAIPEWQIMERDGIMQLERVFTFRNFKQALAFTNRTFRFLAAPRYPAGVDGSLPPIFSSLNTLGVNRKTAENASADPALAPCAFWNCRDLHEALGAVDLANDMAVPHANPWQRRFPPWRSAARRTARARAQIRRCPPCPRR